ncbi:MAG: flavin reductase family protein [Gordonia sp. (in: high G+C Gram-positive bacteria)]
MAASSFTSVSLDPPLVSVCVARTSTTWPMLITATRIGLSVLADSRLSLARALAAKVGDRFADVRWERTPGGAVFVHGSTLWLECAIHDVVPAGDHDIVLLRVEHLQSSPDIAPMVFHGSTFRSLAPTP